MPKIRYNWGICTNRDMDGNGTPCPKCASKEKIRVSLSHDFVCPECGERLQKVRPPKTPIEKYGPVIIAVIVIIVVVIIVFAVMTCNSGKAPKPIRSDSNSTKVLENDSTKKKKSADTIREGPSEVGLTKEPVTTKTHPNGRTSNKGLNKPATESKGGSKNLGYAIFKGSWPNDVDGRMIFKTSHIIDNRDPKQRIADAGDYVIGEFSDGHLVQGIWYSADGTVKGSIIIGK